MEAEEIRYTSGGKTWVSTTSQATAIEGSVTVTISDVAWQAQAQNAF